MSLEHIYHHMLMYIQLIVFPFTGDSYRVTKESLMERLNTNMHEACLNIDTACRSDEVLNIFDFWLFVGFLRVMTISITYLTTSV